MAFTFNPVPTTDLDKLRVHVGDTRYDDGPAPDRANLEDALLEYFLDEADTIPGAAALAFEHLAALWISRPIFGPGELSTMHVDMYKKYMAAAAEWRSRDTGDGGDLGSATVVRVGSFTRVDGYTDAASEYTA